MIRAEFNNEINDLMTENLYQWDTYQTLYISGIDFGSVAPKVHFANKKSTVALVVNGTLTSDGNVEVSIPNSLLTEKYNILAYIYQNSGLTSKTIKSITIPIIPRLKPSEYYQPSDEDIAQIEAIELEAKAIINNLTASAFNFAESYQRPNIVHYNGDMYMCKSSQAITEIYPTNTTYWQRLTDVRSAIANDSQEFEGIDVKNVTIGNAGNVTTTINGVAITDIFEADGKTVKKATNSNNNNSIKSTTYSANVSITDKTTYHNLCMWSTSTPRLVIVTLYIPTFVRYYTATFLVTSDYSYQLVSVPQVDSYTTLSFDVTDGYLKVKGHDNISSSGVKIVQFRIIDLTN